MLQENLVQQLEMQIGLQHLLMSPPWSVSQKTEASAHPHAPTGAVPRISHHLLDAPRPPPLYSINYDA